MHAHARNLRIFRASMCVKFWFTGNSDCAPKTHIILQEITFFNLVTLSFDLWPWQSNLAKILLGHIPIPKIVFIRQTVQSWECWKTDRQTDTQTGPILLPRPLTREVKIFNCVIVVYQLQGRKARKRSADFKNKGACQFSGITLCANFVEPRLHFRLNIVKQL